MDYHNSRLVADGLVGRKHQRTAAVGSLGMNISLQQQEFHSALYPQRSTAFQTGLNVLTAS